MDDSRTAYGALAWQDLGSKWCHSVLTFYSLVEGTVDGHFLDYTDLERIATVLLVEERVHVRGFAGVSDGASHSKAALEHMFSDVAADKLCAVIDFGRSLGRLEG